MLRRSDIAIIDLPREVAPCAILGGSVIVQGAPLSARFRLNESARTDSNKYVSEVLALCVIDEDGSPLMSAAEWDRFAGVHTDSAMELYRIAANILALDGADAEKK